ncbi:4-phospho-D-threonate 3-dehydrogenase [bacterium]|nr:4-phospho-D-threonate 3-dehydrogenase [bacterium]
MNHTDKPIIAVTLGDPAGVGPEITLKALKNERVQQAVRPVVFGDAQVLRQAMDITGLRFNLQPLQRIDQAVFEPNTILVVESDMINAPVQMGVVQGLCGRAVFSYLANATDWTMSGITQAIATAPVSRESLQAGHIPYWDQTEILAKLTQTETPLSLLMNGPLRILLYGRPMPFRQAAEHLTVDGLVAALQRSAEGMRQLGFERPRLAVAALNPGDGEDGFFGNEEAAILAPAVAQACRLGLNVKGPAPADSLFCQALAGTYDAVLALVHDQRRIAALGYDSQRTIELTLGLPFLHIAAIHETALEDAGKNIADPAGMIECLLACSRYGQTAREFLKRTLDSKMKK